MKGTVVNVESEFTKNGDEYKKVTIRKDDGNETTKSIFNNLEKKWPILIEGAYLDFKMEKKGQFWNTVDITAVLNDPQPTQSAPLPPELQKEIHPVDKDKAIARHVWFKELGECLRAGDINTNTPVGSALRKIYYAEMFTVLGIDLEKPE